MATAASVDPRRSLGLNLALACDAVFFTALIYLVWWQRNKSAVWPDVEGPTPSAAAGYAGIGALIAAVFLERWGRRGGSIARLAVVVALAGAVAALTLALWGAVKWTPAPTTGRYYFCLYVFGSVLLLHNMAALLWAGLLAGRWRDGSSALLGRFLVFLTLTSVLLLGSIYGR